MLEWGAVPSCGYLPNPVLPYCRRILYQRSYLVRPSLSHVTVYSPFRLCSSHRMDSTLLQYPSPLVPAPTKSAEGFEVRTAICRPLPRAGWGAVFLSSSILPTSVVPLSCPILPGHPDCRVPVSRLFLSLPANIGNSQNEVDFFFLLGLHLFALISPVYLEVPGMRMQTEGCQSLALELLVIASPLPMLTNTPGLSLSQDPLK